MYNKHINLFLRKGLKYINILFMFNESCAQKSNLLAHTTCSRKFNKLCYLYPHKLRYLQLYRNVATKLTQYTFLITQVNLEGV